jgi:hypothetical protein
MTTKKEKKLPVRLEEQPVQLDLFKRITTQETDSQSLRLWESLANAIFDDKKAVKRIDGLFLKSITEEIEFDNVIVKIEKHPARIERGEEFLDHFPLKKEYKIMEVLIKLAVDEMESGFYSSDNRWPELGITVSLHSIYKQIKSKTGKARFSYAQIKEAIDILARSHISLKVGDNVIEGSLITSYSGNNLSDNTKASFLINFHPIISKLALNGGFRQFNISRSLSLPDIFTSFLYKKFVHNFKQAGKNNSYHFLMENLLKEVPHIAKWKKTTRKVQKVTESLNSLIGDVVLSFESEKKYAEKESGQKAIVDCLFTVKFTQNFIDEQIKANKIKDSNVVYNDDGTMFEKPNMFVYREKYKGRKRASDEYMKDLTKWHEKNKQREENVVQRTFKK